MPERPFADLPRDTHPQLSPAQDAAQRGHVGPDLRPWPVPFPHDHVLPTDLGPIARQRTLFPYLLIRSFRGDSGARPHTGYVWWEGMDVHLIPDGESGFDVARTVLAPRPGAAYRIAVHIWNLGAQTATGVRVRAWAAPMIASMTSAPTTDDADAPTLVAGTYVELGPRHTDQAHRIVLLDGTWTPRDAQEARSTLYATIDCATDPWGGSFASHLHRHVACRALVTLDPDETLEPVLQQLVHAWYPDQGEWLWITTVPVNATSPDPRAGSITAAAVWRRTPMATGDTDHLLGVAALASDGLRGRTMNRFARWDNAVLSTPGDFSHGFKRPVLPTHRLLSPAQLIEEFCTALLPFGAHPTDITAHLALAALERRADPTPRALRLVIGTKEEPATRGCTVVLSPDAP